MNAALLANIADAQDPLAAARESELLFVRSQDHLALANDGSTGRKLNAIEALQAYGIDALIQVMDHGSAILPQRTCEPASTLRSRREALGLSLKDIARQTELPLSVIASAEDVTKRNNIRDIERIAESLGLDERFISFRSGAGGDDHLATRLKRLGGTPRMTPKLVLTLSEAAWVIGVYGRLRNELELLSKWREIEPRPVFSEPGYPVWQQGYALAAETRRRIGLNETSPIESVRELCAGLGMPLLQSAMPRFCAGATVASNGFRGMVINTEGFNTNVWVRRATIAHELGHLLWDPEEQLDRLAVDEYGDIASLNEFDGSHYEARANAFAIALLAPPDAVREFYSAAPADKGLIRVAQHFGISYSAAKFHIANVTGCQPAGTSLKVEPSEDWIGRESFTSDFFPLKETPTIRRGDFTRICLRAKKEGLVSVDTLASYLCSTVTNYQEHEAALDSIFGEHVEAP